MSRGAGRRRRGRELALRVLFELEGTQRDPVPALAYQAEEIGATPDVVAHAAELIDRCLTQAATIDEAIASASTHWRLEEIGKVERAVLRLGACELLFAGDVPVSVVIDEAIELARTYAGSEAAPFVNGVLGRIAEHAREAV